ncbi:TolC family outer membrane protein [Chitinilyticum litopenaei]|uniref:TolC family outer membrane protein n=1 Tax=Chitinilyticum litopenaei TaxID=1121276 RepID=UPI00041DA486|nr:TolC family outer membrane protein [Chitinilyticum litopenaei]
MLKLKKTLLLVPFACACSAMTSAGELFDLYQLALGNDARYAAARAQQQAAQQLVPLARSGLLPKIALSGSYSREAVNSESPNILGRMAEREYRFTSESYSANLIQPLYRQASLEEYWQAQWQVKSADALLNRNLDDLKRRLTESYLEVQLAQARIALIEQQKIAYAELRRQAQRSFESGYGTLTEVAESQSRLDELLSEEVSAKAAYDNRLTELRNIIGRPTYVTKLAEVPDFVPDMHAGKSREDWIALAELNAPLLKEQQAKVKAAEYEVGKARAGFLPTLDLRLQYSNQKNPGYTNINTTNDSASVLLSLSVPVFEGGATLAQSRRAAAELLAAREASRGVGDDLRATIAKEFDTVTALAVRIDALEKSVKTNELLVHATEKSVSAGVRTNVDSLNAQSRLFEARLRLTESRISYLLSMVNLRTAAGLVQDEELLKIDELLRSSTAKS